MPIDKSMIAGAINDMPLRASESLWFLLSSFQVILSIMSHAQANNNALEDWVVSWFVTYVRNHKRPRLWRSSPQARPLAVTAQ